MPPTAKTANLTVQISAGEESDASELDQLTRQLLAEIKELEVESVELVKSGATPEGTKSVEAVTLGALAVAVLPTIVPKLIELLQTWSMRGENRIVKIKTQHKDRSLEMEYSPKTMSSAEVKSLVNALTKALSVKDESD